MTGHWRRNIAVILALGFLWAWIAPLSTALAFDPGRVILEMPVAAPARKPGKAPTTSGPLLSDTCLPIETHHGSMQFLWTWSITRANFSPNWRQVSARGDFNTLGLAAKFSYGPAQDLEINIALPFLYNFAGQVDTNQAHTTGKHAAGYSGCGDISLEGKYLLMAETEIRPAVAGVFGLGMPSGHASHLNPKRLGADAIGGGAFIFTTGVNLSKWLEPFLLYSNIWINTPVNLFTSRNDAVRSREFVTFNLAAEYPITEQWVALLEIYSTWTWNNISTPQGFQSPSTELGALAGIEFLATEKWSVAAGAAIDLIGKAGGAKITPVFTIYYNF